jgi:hypothetical protein
LKGGDFMNKRKTAKMSAEALLDIMGAYLRQISRNGEQYPEAVLDDIRCSIKSVLKRNGYEGRYVAELEEKGEY